MNAVSAGVLIALLVVGYPLYDLVTTGQLDGTSALLRGAVVAGGCGVGIMAIVHLALSYEDAEHHRRERRMNALFTEMEGAAKVGLLADEDPAGPAGPGPTQPGDGDHPGDAGAAADPADGPGETGPEGKPQLPDDPVGTAEIVSTWVKQDPS